MPTSLKLSQPVHSRPQNFVDERGYAFMLPELGLPNPSGEWHMIQAAVGPKGLGTPAYFYDASKKDPRRYASPSCGLLEVESEGALWILPIVTPLKTLPAIESFHVKARRVRLDTVPKKERLQFPDNVEAFVVYEEDPAAGETHDNAAAATSSRAATATEADEDTFWEHSLTSVFSPERKKGRYEVGMRQSKHTEEESKARLKWLEAPDQALDQTWCQQQMLQAFQEAELTKVRGASFSPGFSLQAVPCGQSVRFEYAITTRKGHPAQPHDWRPLPSRAFKPGKELIFVNQARQRLGKRAYTQQELEREQAERR